MNIRPDNRQRRKVILLAMLFAAPVIAALALRQTGWQPGATGNHGELVEPAAELPAGAVPDLLRGHWLLVGMVPSDCREECDSLRQDLLRVRRALGKDGHRIRLLLSGPDNVPGESNAGPLFPAPPSMRDALGSLKAAPPPGGVLVIDPRGFLVLRYAPGFRVAGLLDDMERLLRYTRVGVQ